MTTGIRIFREAGCVSYVVWDRGSREAIAIDPSLALIRDYRELLFGQGLRLTEVVDTSIASDQLSAAAVLAREFSCGVVCGEAADSRLATRRLREGDEVRFGRHSLRTIATPGVAPEAIVLFGEACASRPWLFSGGTLLIGATGRTDFAWGDAGTLFRSLRDRLSSLPDTAVVFPSRDLTGVCFSTVGRERALNAEWRIQDETEFVRLKRGESRPSPSEEEIRILAYNRGESGQTPPHVSPAPGPVSSGAPRSNDAGFGTISADKYRAKLDSRDAGTVYVDVRESEEFAQGHMPGVVNWPLSELASQLDELEQAKRIYLSCWSGRRSEQAARTLARLGFKDVVNVAGGFQAWKQAGLPWEK